MHIGYARIAINTVDAEKGKKARVIVNDQEKRLYRAGAEVVIKEQYLSPAVNYPVLGELLKQMKAGDTLLVTKLAQLARTAAEARIMIKSLLDRGVKVNVLTMGIIESCFDENFVMDSLNKFVAVEKAIFGEILPAEEVKPQKAEKAEPKKRSTRAKAIPENLDEYVEKVKSGELTVAAACEALEISRSTWYKWIKKD